MTEKEKTKIDKEVRKNRLELKFAIFFRLQMLPLLSQISIVDPVEGFNPEPAQSRDARDRALERAELRNERDKAAKRFEKAKP